MKQFFSAAKAIADPTRVKIIKFLLKRELCVCEIQEFLQLAQSTVSRHMKTLEDAGLVEHRRQGTWVMYSLPRYPESAFGVTMIENLEDWLEDDKELQEMRLNLNVVMQNSKTCNK